jgi:hypothetical protein
MCVSKEELTKRMSLAIDELHEACLPFAQILCEALELHSKKSQDYGSDSDPYANVRASEEFGIPAWKGALMRCNDKVVRLKRFSQRGSLANESAEDSLKDLCVYFPIALMLYRQASHEGS